MDGRRIVQQALDAQRARDSHWMGPGLSVDQAMTALNVVSSKGMSPGSAAGREMVRQALDAQRVSGTRGLNDKLHISPDDTEFDPDSTTSTLGSTGAGSLYISLTRTFVQAVAHTYSD